VYVNVNENATNAYILFALTQAGETDVVNEVLALKNYVTAQIKTNTQDAYVLSLLATALYNLKRSKEATVFTDSLKTLQNANGTVSRVAYTVSGSTGILRETEATAFALLAWNR
jgi:hypothetical protein